MKIPNNKNIILFLDSRERKFKTSNNNSWNFSNRIDAMNLRLFPRKVYHMLITINMKSDIAFVAISNNPCSIKGLFGWRLVRPSQSVASHTSMASHTSVAKKLDAKLWQKLAKNCLYDKWAIGAIKCGKPKCGKNQTHAN